MGIYNSCISILQNLLFRSSWFAGFVEVGKINQAKIEGHAEAAKKAAEKEYLESNVSNQDNQDYIQSLECELFENNLRLSDTQYNEQALAKRLDDQNQRIISRFQEAVQSHQYVIAFELFQVMPQTIWPDSCNHCNIGRLAKLAADQSSGVSQISYYLEKSKTALESCPKLSENASLCFDYGNVLVGLALNEIISQKKVDLLKSAYHFFKVSSELVESSASLNNMANTALYLDTMIESSTDRLDFVQGALKLSENAVALDNKNDKAWNNWGRSLTRLADVEPDNANEYLIQAIDKFDKSLLMIDNITCHIEKGRALVSLANLASEIKLKNLYYNQALNSFQRGFYASGSLQLKAHLLEQAAEVHQLLRNTSNSLIHLMSHTAWAYMLYDRALGFTPHDGKLLFNTGVWKLRIVDAQTRLASKHSFLIKVISKISNQSFTNPISDILDSLGYFDRAALFTEKPLEPLYWKGRALLWIMAFQQQLGVGQANDKESISIVLNQLIDQLHNIYPDYSYLLKAGESALNNDINICKDYLFKVSGPELMPFDMEIEQPMTIGRYSGEEWFRNFVTSKC